MGMGLGQLGGLGRLGRPRLEGGGYAATLAAFRDFLAANVDDDNPHSLPAMASPPTITISTGTDAAPSAPYTALTVRYRYVTPSNVFRYFGGGDYLTETRYRRFPVATQAPTGGNIGANDGKSGNSWRVSFTADAQDVGICLRGTTTAFRFIVDGEYVDLTGTVTSTTSGRNFITLSFGSKAAHTITVEGEQAAAFDGVHVAVGDTVTLPDAVEPSMIVLGDSFSTGTGATLQGDGFIPVVADYLGVQQRWAAGVGSTGYVNTSSGTRYKLSERLVTDLDRFIASVGQPAVIGVAMGINDISSHASVQAEAASCFATIRSMCPAALVFVVGAWDVNAPSPPVANYAACKSAIQAAVGTRGGFYFIDPQGVEYTKADATHPDTAGHLLLGEWLNDQIRAAVAA